MGLGATLKKALKKVEGAAEDVGRFAERAVGVETYKRAVKKPSVGRVLGATLETVSQPIAPVKGIFRIPLGGGGPAPVRRPGEGSSPEEIRRYIDASLGLSEDDDEIIKLLDARNAFAKSISVYAPARPGETLNPYTDDMAARLGTKAVPPALSLDPYSPTDQRIMEMIQGDQRLIALYLRETDPAKLLPFLPAELGPRRKQDTVFSKSMDAAGDILGRPIGGLLEALSWPSQQVENFIGQKLVWNNVPDAYVRRQLLKSTYEFGITGTDWKFHNSRVADINRAARDLFAQGLRGEDAWQALQPTLKDNMSTRAAIFGFLASATLDPLWGLGIVGKGVSAGAKGIGAVEPLGKAAGLLPKLPRVLGPGREVLNSHTLREIMAADEITYQGWRLASPARGPLLRLFEQSPNGYAAEAARRFNAIFSRNDSLTPEATRLFDEVVKAGKVTPEAEALVGRAFVDNPQMARFIAMARRSGWNLTDEVFGKGKRQIQSTAALEQIAQESPDAAGWIIRQGIMSHLEDFARIEQEKVVPKFITRRIRPIVNAEKAAMGVFTLSRPSFVPLNMANNLFTFMWHASDPVRAVGYGKAWVKSLFTEFSTALPGAGYPDEFRRILSVADVSPGVAESIITSGTTGGDLLGLKAKQFLRGELDDPAEAKSLLKFASEFERNPAKMPTEFTWRSVLSWPVDMASHVDRATRRAAYMMSLKEQYHWALRPKVLTQALRDRLQAEGWDGDRAEKITRKMVSNLRREAGEGTAVFRPEEMERVFRETIADLGDEITPPLSSLDYMLRWAQSKGMSGDQAWAFIAPLQSFEGPLNDILDDIAVLSKTKREATITGLADNIYDFDYIQAILTNTQPIVRQSFTYGRGLRVTEDSMRQATADNLNHLERLFKQVYVGKWSGRLRRDFYENVGRLMSEHMDELAEIRRVHQEAILADLAPGEATAPLWDAFWENNKNRWSGIYGYARETLGEVHQGPLEGLDRWYANHQRMTGRHREAIQEALTEGGDEAWAKASQIVKNLYTQEARRNAEIFGWSVNETPTNLGHERPSALLATRADEFTEWLKAEITTDLSRVPEEFSAEVAGLRQKLAQARKDIRSIQRKKLPDEAEARVKEIDKEVKAIRDERERLVAAGQPAPQLREMAERESALDKEREEIVSKSREALAPLLQTRKDLQDQLKKLEDLSPLRQTAQERRSLLASIEKTVPELSKAGAGVKQMVQANAMAKTDFAMLNYNQQYGIDSITQVFFPYMFFPSRTAVNWGIRLARAPGAGALISKALLHPKEYAELYGYPTRLENYIPIPMPFLGNMLQDVPVLNTWLQTGKFSHMYWVDPMQLMFPLTSFTRDFDDEKRKSTPLGLMLDWSENYVPFGLSPIAKIIGSEVGLLDKDAWEQSLFSGGPFGVPLTPLMRGVMGWLQAGDPAGVPESEQENYANGGFFSSGFLARIFNLSNPRFDAYRAERALWSLVATDSLLPDKDHETQTAEAWKAMLSHEGPAWRSAVRHAQSEQFLREFTGATFARVQPILEGELKLKMALKTAYNEARRQGPDALKLFHEKYPEYEGYQAAVKGISDPDERERAVETEMFFRTVNQYAEQPYALSLDRLDEALYQLAHQTQTEATRDQIRVLKLQRSQIQTEKAAVRSVIEKAFPMREDEPSRNRDPFERALSIVRGEWYDLLEDETPLSDEEKTLVRRVLLNDKPSQKELSQVRKIIERQAQEVDFEELEKARAAYLKQFPAKPAEADPNLWHELSVESMLVKVRYGLQISDALTKEDFNQFRRLETERDAALDAIHDVARESLTRWDVENYFSRQERPKTPEEKEFERADALFDLWMALVDDRSPLRDREKDAISAYFRARPEIKKHYATSTLDLRKLTIDQKYALGRRREIWRTYYDIEGQQAQLDYMASHQQEINALNGLLGLRPLTLIDYDRMTPYAQLGSARRDFKRDVEIDRRIKELASQQNLSRQEREELERLIEERDPSTLSEAEIDRYVRLALQRGY